MAFFIAWPFLAAVPAAAYLALYRLSGHRLALTAAVVWAAYLLYEYGMKLRILCSGECNIRVDLLLVYPVLLGLSLAAAYSGWRTIRRRRSLGT